MPSSCRIRWNDGNCCFRVSVFVLFLMSALMSTDSFAEIGTSQHGSMHSSPSDRVCIAIPFQLIRQSEKLAVLNLSDNRVTIQGMQDLMQAIGESTTTLRTLVLCDVCFSSQAASPHIEAALADHPSLQDLELDYNNLEDDAAAALLAALATNTTLTRLRYAHNACDDALPWGKLLETNTTLLSLEIEGSLLDVGPVLGALQVNSTLKKLNVSGSRLGARQVPELVRGLGQNTTLQTLIMADMKWDTANGPVHLYNALALNSSITELNLNNMKLDSPGLFFASIIRSTSLRDLNLRK